MVITQILVTAAVLSIPNILGLFFSVKGAKCISAAAIQEMGILNLLKARIFFLFNNFLHVMFFLTS